MTLGTRESSVVATSYVANNTTPNTQGGPQCASAPSSAPYYLKWTKHAINQVKTRVLDTNRLLESTRPLVELDVLCCAVTPPSGT